MNYKVEYSIDKQLCNNCHADIRSGIHGIMLVNGYPAGNCPKQCESYQEVTVTLKESIVPDIEMPMLFWARKYITHLSDKQLEEVIDKDVTESRFLSNFGILSPAKSALINKFDTQRLNKVQDRINFKEMWNYINGYAK